MKIRAASQRKQGRRKKRGTCGVINDSLHHAIKLGASITVFILASARPIFVKTKEPIWLIDIRSWTPSLPPQVRWIISLALANAGTAPWMRVRKERCSFRSRLHRCGERSYQSRYTKRSIVAGPSAIGIKKYSLYKRQTQMKALCHHHHLRSAACDFCISG